TSLRNVAAMGVWRDYKVLIVMGGSLALIHAGWYQLKARPHLYKSAARQPAGGAKSE
uniref:MFS transporter n=1 Tax=Hippocampus comes TaxID=109280 RepID=A0A3Q2XT57_HIPCM